MQIQEFPKALYEGGDAEKAFVIVKDTAEEGVQREKGFRMVGEPAPEKDAKPKKLTA